LLCAGTRLFAAAFEMAQFPLALKYKKLLTTFSAHYCFFVRPAYGRPDVSLNNQSSAILQRVKNVHYLLAPQLNYPVARPTFIPMKLMSTADPDARDTVESGEN
jgi:hypothetical protein